MIFKRIIAIVLMASTLLFSACSNSKEDKKTINSTETFSSQAEVLNDASYESLPKNKTKADLIADLKAELSKKNFNDRANKLFIDIAESLYENYSCWMDGYSDMPTKEQYIQNNLINIIKVIEDVIIYDEDSKKDFEYRLWVNFHPEKQTPIIYVVEDSGFSEKDYIELFFHEVAHCKQYKILDYGYFDSYEEIESIIIEGGATFHQKFVNPLEEEPHGAAAITNKSESLEINYYKDNGLGYPSELAAYEKLVYLAGYNTINKIENMEIPFSALEEKIAQKYGNEKAKKLFEIMRKWYAKYNSENQITYIGDDVYNLSIELEKIFLEFIKFDINSLKTKDEVKKYIKKYDYFKAKILPQVTDAEYNNLTEKTFNISELDRLLNNKVNQFGMQYTYNN